jgi:hypothetical protein
VHLNTKIDSEKQNKYKSTNTQYDTPQNNNKMPCEFCYSMVHTLENCSSPWAVGRLTNYIVKLKHEVSANNILYYPDFHEYLSKKYPTVIIKMILICMDLPFSGTKNLLMERILLNWDIFLSSPRIRELFVPPTTTYTTPQTTVRPPPTRILQRPQQQQQTTPTKITCFTLATPLVIQEETCSICLENTTNIMTNCGHHFCQCIVEHISNKKIENSKNAEISCPNCRQEITALHFNNPEQYGVLKSASKMLPSFEFPVV